MSSMSNDKRVELSGTAVPGVKNAIGYTSGKRTCRNCVHLGKSELLSGNHDARPDRCELSRGFWFPIDLAGSCNHWEHVNPDEKS